MSTDAEGILTSLHEASRRIAVLTSERDRALVAGAAAVGTLREALRKYGTHLRGCRPMYDVQEVYDGSDPRKNCNCGLDAAFASPPTLPDPEAALAAFAAFVRDECAISAADGGEVDIEHGITIPSPSNETAAENVRYVDAADLARRWLEGEGR